MIVAAAISRPLYVPSLYTTDNAVRLLGYKYIEFLSPSQL